MYIHAYLTPIMYTELSRNAPSIPTQFARNVSTPHDHRCV